MSAILEFRFLGEIDMKDFPAIIGKNVLEIRARRKMSQELLEQLTGISQDQISRFESGERIPSVRQLVAMCEALGCSPSEMLKCRRRPS